jgi:hypothetical protein
MPYLTPDSAPGTTICRTLVIPADTYWLAIVNGALSELCKKWNFEKYGELTPEETAEAFAVMFDDFLASECEGAPAMVYPDNAFLLYQQFEPLFGNPMAASLVASQFLGFVYFNSPGTTDDYSRATITLRAGDYKLYILYQSATNGGKKKVWFNTDNVGEVDMYHSPAQVDQTATFNITQTEDGQAEIGIEGNGKNASSSGYQANISFVTIFPR